MNGLYNFGRDALLLEALSTVATCDDAQNFWSDSIAQLKWILDFTRVDVALRNPDELTYSLKTVFELRPVALACESALPVSKGTIGKMMRSGEACHVFEPRRQRFAPECIVDPELEGGSLSSVMSLSLKAGNKVLGVLSFGSEKHAYCHKDTEIAARFATHAAIAIQNWQQLTRLKEDAILLTAAAEKLKDSQSRLESLVAERTAALRDISSRLLKTQEEERRRIARDLHDSTSQILAALLMNVGALQQRFAKEEFTSGALTEIAALAKQAVREIRTSSYLLHPPLLDQAGLGSAARWYVDGFSKRSGILVDMDFPDDSERFASDVEMVLFRVLQEGLTNVHRHSGASQVKVQLARTVEGVHLVVQDNGHGVAPELVARLGNGFRGTGVGLAGMRERLNDLDGQLELMSNSGGTTLRVTVPLASGEGLARSATA